MNNLVQLYLQCRDAYQCYYFIYEIELPAIWWTIRAEDYVAYYTGDSPQTGR